MSQGNVVIVIDSDDEEEKKSGQTPSVALKTDSTPEEQRAKDERSREEGEEEEDDDKSLLLECEKKSQSEKSKVNSKVSEPHLVIPKQERVESESKENSPLKALQWKNGTGKQQDTSPPRKKMVKSSFRKSPSSPSKPDISQQTLPTLFTRQRALSTSPEKKPEALTVPDKNEVGHRREEGFSSRFFALQQQHNSTNSRDELTRSIPSGSTSNSSSSYSSPPSLSAEAVPKPFLQKLESFKERREVHGDQQESGTKGASSHLRRISFDAPQESSKSSTKLQKHSLPASSHTSQQSSKLVSTSTSKGELPKQSTSLLRRISSDASQLSSKSELYSKSKRELPKQSLLRRMPSDTSQQSSKSQSSSKSNGEKEKRQSAEELGAIRDSTAKVLGLFSKFHSKDETFHELLRLLYGKYEELTHVVLSFGMAEQNNGASDEGVHKLLSVVKDVQGCDSAWKVAMKAKKFLMEKMQKQKRMNHALALLLLFLSHCNLVVATSQPRFSNGLIVVGSFIVVEQIVQSKKVDKSSVEFAYVVAAVLESGLMYDYYAHRAVGHHSFLSGEGVRRPLLEYFGSMISRCLKEDPSKNRVVELVMHGLGRVMLLLFEGLGNEAIHEDRMETVLKAFLKAIKFQDLQEYIRWLLNTHTKPVVIRCDESASLLENRLWNYGPILLGLLARLLKEYGEQIEEFQNLPKGKVSKFAKKFDLFVSRQQSNVDDHSLELLGGWPFKVLGEGFLQRAKRQAEETAFEAKEGSTNEQQEQIPQQQQEHQVNGTIKENQIDEKKNGGPILGKRKVSTLEEGDTSIKKMKNDKSTKPSATKTEGETSTSTNQEETNNDSHVVGLSPSFVACLSLARLRTQKSISEFLSLLR